MITSVNPKFLKLSTYDDRIYDEFRLSFPDFDVSNINEDEMKSESGKAVIADVAQQCKCYSSLLKCYFLCVPMKNIFYGIKLFC